MAKYVKCPRCELNYMKDGENYCDVCKAELRLINISNEEEDLELCPICGINFIKADQTMCDECMKKGVSIDEMDRDESPSDGSDWETKQTSESTEDGEIEVLSLSEIIAHEEDFDDDDEEEEVDHFEEEDDDDNDDDDFDFDVDDDSDDSDDDDDDDDDDLF